METDKERERGGERGKREDEKRDSRQRFSLHMSKIQEKCYKNLFQIFKMFSFKVGPVSGMLL